MPAVRRRRRKSARLKLLLVEDEARVARFIKRGLTEEGHVVDVTASGIDAIALGSVTEYDVIILDVMLPGKSGYHVASELRAKGNSTPILMLTARDSREDIIHGLDVGADDYLTKPFDFEELLARIRAVARRARTVDENTLRFAEIELDRLQHSAHRGSRRLDLTPTEFKLLESLMLKPGQAVKRIELLDRVWGMSFDPGTNLIDVHVANLRKKLEDGGEKRLIVAVRGVGFRLGSA
jgi:DNA-binding response OmpR family regulator